MSLVWAELGGLLVTALGLLCFLGPMGIMGAALASILGYGMVCVLLLVQARSITGYSVREMLIPSRASMRFGLTIIRRMAWEE